MEFKCYKHRFCLSAIYLLVFSITCGSCKSLKKKPKEIGELVFKVSPHPCYGVCEVFDFSLFTKGRVLLEIQENGKSASIGRYYFDLISPDYEQLHSEFENSNIKIYRRKPNLMIKDGASFTFYTKRRDSILEQPYVLGEDEKIDYFIKRIKYYISNSMWKKDV